VPAPAALRVALLVLAALVAVAILFTVVFPWFDRTFLTDPVLDAPPSQGA